MSNTQARRSAAAYLAARNAVRVKPETCVLDFFKGSPPLADGLTDTQLADLRPDCSWECSEGCPYSGN